MRYTYNILNFSLGRVNIKFISATKDNARGYRPDLSIIIGDFDDDTVCRIRAHSFGGLIWFKDSKEFIEYFKKFNAQDKGEIK